MKKLLFILLFFAGCKKISDVQIQVKDAVTNTPVKGITVGIHRCTNSTNPFCGLIPYTSEITNDNGICRFDKEDYAQAMTITASKADYWAIQLPISTSLNIYPEGWIQLRIIRGTNYPPKSKLRISIYNTFSRISSSTECNIATDSIIMVRGFGGLSNEINWRVYDSTSNELNRGTWDQMIPRLDKVNATLNY